jgi:hypothetical protein
MSKNAKDSVSAGEALEEAARARFKKARRPAVTSLFEQARKEQPLLKQQIRLAILKGETAQVQNILAKRFVPDRETLLVAAASDSTDIFMRIANAGSFSDYDFKLADEANSDAYKDIHYWSDMHNGAIRDCRGRLARAALVKAHSGSVKTATA